MTAVPIPTNAAGPIRPECLRAAPPEDDPAAMFPKQSIAIAPTVSVIRLAGTSLMTPREFSARADCQTQIGIFPIFFESRRLHCLLLVLAYYP